MPEGDDGWRLLSMEDWGWVPWLDQGARAAIQQILDADQPIMLTAGGDVRTDAIDPVGAWAICTQVFTAGAIVDGAGDGAEDRRAHHCDVGRLD